ncbi:MAG: DUF5915 domain-containing protein, partial [Candidatus Aenigmatarchaeota archaeon]
MEKSTDILKEMLNVKEVEVGEVEVHHTIKLNYSQIGPKFGSDEKKIEKLLDDKDDEKLFEEFEQNGKITLGEFELKGGDI